MPEITPRSLFSDKLHRLGPKHLLGIPEDLLEFISANSETDLFYSDAVADAFYDFAADPLRAVESALVSWTDEFLTRLDDLLGPRSALPALLTQPELRRWSRVRKQGTAKLLPRQAQISAFAESLLLDLASISPNPRILLQAVVKPVRKTGEGKLIEAIRIPWRAIIRVLLTDWNRAFEIPYDKWEELIAGAFDVAGYDEVVLTPRSGDYGRDVIAVKKGVGTIRIIDSVKAYKPGHLVGHDDVRALAGVLFGDPRASKAILTTTSDFAPTLAQDPFIGPLIPFRIELMNGSSMRTWMESLIG